MGLGPVPRKEWSQPFPLVQPEWSFLVWLVSAQWNEWRNSLTRQQVRVVAQVVAQNSVGTDEVAQVRRSELVALQARLAEAERV